MIGCYIQNFICHSHIFLTLIIGEEPLDLSNIFYLAMDWKNNPKCKPHVLAQSKELVCLVSGCFCTLEIIPHCKASYYKALSCQVEDIVFFHVFN